MTARALLLLAVITAVPATASDGSASVRVTHKHLVPRCLDGAAVAAAGRSWRLPAGPHTLAFTMRNEPRAGTVAKGEPGVAAVTFTAEAGHKYEVEAHAAPASYAARVWEKGAWKPVVRDRTAERVVSDEPKWMEAGCTP